MSVLEESRPFAQQLSNVYFTILSLFCFKLFVKISLAILSHFYIVKGNRKEAARIAAEFYGVTQGQGADVHKGKYWDTPLHAAAQQPSTDIVNLLIEFGADINAKNIELLRPVDMATSNGAVERVLLQHEDSSTSSKTVIPSSGRLKKMYFVPW
ncbi:Ankyrin repeat and SOCS box protein 5 [Cricetulus griseus]|uniref:Ankyrin repeat and SOCS box protein 5 n=1 Tax=Cricetulus griseus TaxID=10029 RepID=G3I2U7_CRIGR|nr:Ankyrin repeat and SOCS box protein 5 [Cricetulus griseus]